MVSNCIREPRRWESAAVNPLHPGLLSPPAPCWGSVVPVVTVSANFKGFADTQGVSYDISLHNRGVCSKAQPSGEPEMFKTDRCYGAVLPQPCTGGVK